MSSRTKATIDDLYHVPDNAKAELVNGEIVLMPPTGDAPGYAGDEVAFALRDYCRRTGFGRAVGDNKGFRVNLPHRELFGPDAALRSCASTGRASQPTRQSIAVAEPAVPSWRMSVDDLFEQGGQ